MQRQLAGLKNVEDQFNKNSDTKLESSAGLNVHLTHLFLPVFDLVVVFSNGGLDLLDAESDTEGFLLQSVLLLLKDFYLLQYSLILLLHFRESSLDRKQDTSLN